MSVTLLTTFDFYCDLLTGQGFLNALFLAYKKNYVVLILMKFHKSGLPIISVIQNLVVSHFPFLVVLPFLGPEGARFHRVGSTMRLASGSISHFSFCLSLPTLWETSLLLVYSSTIFGSIF